jgi:hypothetical protein
VDGVERLVRGAGADGASVDDERLELREMQVLLRSLCRLVSFSIAHPSSPATGPPKKKSKNKNKNKNKNKKSSSTWG